MDGFSFMACGFRSNTTFIRQVNLLIQACVMLPLDGTHTKLFFLNTRTQETDQESLLTRVDFFHCCLCLQIMVICYFVLFLSKSKDITILFCETFKWPYHYLLLILLSFITLYFAPFGK